MATQAFILVTSAQKGDVDALYDDEADGNVVPIEIDNPLANQLGEGTLVGSYVFPARVLNDDLYNRYDELCSSYPIYTWDSDVLFTPAPL